MYVVTAEQMRELDRQTIEGLGIPAVALMENAGRAIAEEIIALCKRRGKVDAEAASYAGSREGFSVSGDASLTLGTAAAERWLVLVGKGNNGGDGLVAARHLSEAGIAVTLVYAASPESLTGEVALQRDAAAAMGLPAVVYGRDSLDIAGCSGILDALLGTGAAGAPRGAYAELIAAANRSGKKIVSADIPSGLDADTGQTHEPCIHASVTVCLAFLK